MGSYSCGVAMTRVCIGQARSSPARFTMLRVNGQGGVVTLITDTSGNVNFAGDGGLGGFAGCNNFNSSYSVNGNNISINAPGSTQVLCAEPEGIMEQETQILAALQTASTFTISGNTLEMRDGGGSIAMILQSAP